MTTQEGRADFAGDVLVTHDWAPLHTVIVGRPFYRIPKPLPEHWGDRVDVALWQKVESRAGMTLLDAMPGEHERCLRQMNAAIDLLVDEGVRVLQVPEFTPGEEAFPAPRETEAIQFFPRDALLVIGDHVIELCTRDARRRRERAPLRRLLVEQSGLASAQITTMPWPDPADCESDPWPYLEGGDCLIAGRDIFVGVGGRSSNHLGAAWLQEALGGDYRVVPVKVAPQVLHLDLVMSLVRPGLGIIWRDGLAEGLPEGLVDWQWIEIDEGEALDKLAANVLPLSGDCCLVPSMATHVIEALKGFGVRALPVEFEAIGLFNGGPRCWSHPLIRH